MPSSQHPWLQALDKSYASLHTSIDAQFRLGKSDAQDQFNMLQHWWVSEVQRISDAIVPVPELVGELDLVGLRVGNLEEAAEGMKGEREKSKEDRERGDARAEKLEWEISELRTLLKEAVDKWNGQAEMVETLKRESEAQQVKLEQVEAACDGFEALQAQVELAEREEQSVDDILRDEIEQLGRTVAEQKVFIDSQAQALSALRADQHEPTLKAIQSIVAKHHSPIANLDTKVDGMRHDHETTARMHKEVVQGMEAAIRTNEETMTRFERTFEMNTERWDSARIALEKPVEEINARIDNSERSDDEASGGLKGGMAVLNDRMSRFVERYESEMVATLGALDALVTSVENSSTQTRLLGPDHISGMDKRILREMLARFKGSVFVSYEKSLGNEADPIVRSAIDTFNDQVQSTLVDVTTKRNKYPGLGITSPSHDSLQVSVDSTASPLPSPALRGDFPTKLTSLLSGESEPNEFSPVKMTDEDDAQRIQAYFDQLARVLGEPIMERAKKLEEVIAEFERRMEVLMAEGKRGRVASMVYSYDRKVSK